MITEYYKIVMDPSVNPLKDLKPVQKYQIMTYLSLMWTGLFCAATGAYFWFDELLIGHAFVLTGTFITMIVFERAQTHQRPEIVKTHRDYPRADGTAKYDDIWGSDS